jgi:hypothetical protein
MSALATIECPHCGKRYKLTAEYLSSYGGRETACQGCGLAMLLPTAAEMGVEPEPAPATAPAAARPLAYASAEYPPRPAQGAWRDGQFVVCRRLPKLPPRCFRCNEPTDAPPTQVVLNWVPPEKRRRTGMMFLLGGFLPGLISMLANRSTDEQITLELRCCPAHRVPMRLGKVAAALFALVLVGFALAVGFRDTSFGPYLLFVPAGLIVAGIVVSIIPYPLCIAAWDKDYAWIEGFPKPFRTGLPSLKEAYEQEVTTSAERLKQLHE